jgi:hypothetical protein
LFKIYITNSIDHVVVDVVIKKEGNKKITKQCVNIIWIKLIFWTFIIYHIINNSYYIEYIKSYILDEIIYKNGVFNEEIKILENIE